MTAHALSEARVATEVKQIPSFYDQQNIPSENLVSSAGRLVDAWDRVVPQVAMELAAKLIERVDADIQSFKKVDTTSEKIFYGARLATEGVAGTAIMAPGLARILWREPRFRKRLLREYPDQFRPKKSSDIDLTRGPVPKKSIEAYARALVKQSKATQR